MSAQLVHHAHGWGDHEWAIHHWQTITGRTAPAPTIDTRHGPRANPVFVEWAMGLPDGWVTSPQLGLSRSAHTKALGNGVVPQQAAMALRLLLDFAATGGKE